MPYADGSKYRHSTARLSASVARTDRFSRALNAAAGASTSRRWDLTSGAAVVSPIVGWRSQLRSHADVTFGPAKSCVRNQGRTVLCTNGASTGAVSYSFVCRRLSREVFRQKNFGHYHQQTHLGNQSVKSANWALNSTTKFGHLWLCDCDRFDFRLLLKATAIPDIQSCR